MQLLKHWPDILASRNDSSSSIKLQKKSATSQQNMALAWVLRIPKLAVIQSTKNRLAAWAHFDEPEWHIWLSKWLWESKIKQGNLKALLTMLRTFHERSKVSVVEVWITWITYYFDVMTSCSLSWSLLLLSFKAGSYDMYFSQEQQY